MIRIDGFGKLRPAAAWGVAEAIQVGWAKSAGCELSSTVRDRLLSSWRAALAFAGLCESGCRCTWGGRDWSGLRGDAWGCFLELAGTSGFILSGGAYWSIRPVGLVIFGGEA